MGHEHIDGERSHRVDFDSDWVVQTTREGWKQLMLWIECASLGVSNANKRNWSMWVGRDVSRTLMWVRVRVRFRVCKYP